MHLPKRIYFTGIPGSRWSGVAQILETLPGMNTTDRDPSREYKHGEFSGHVGMYYGPGMECEPHIRTLEGYKDASAGCCLLKSHHWAYALDSIKEDCDITRDWILLVRRRAPDAVEKCWNWWQQAGGFDITYPSYSWYQNSRKMKQEMRKQKNHIKLFAFKHGLEWHHFTPGWVHSVFGEAPAVDIPDKYDDVEVTIYIP